MEMITPGISIKLGKRTTTTIYSNGQKSGVVSLYSDQEINQWTGIESSSVGINSKLCSTEFSISPDEIRYSKANIFGGRNTFFITSNYQFGYEYSCTISWDDIDTTVYFAESVSCPVALAGGMIYVFGLVECGVAIPTVANFK